MIGTRDAHMSDLIWRLPLDRLSGKVNLALVIFIKAGNTVEESRFPGAIWTDDADDCTGRNMERQIVDGDQGRRNAW